MPLGRSSVEGDALGISVPGADGSFPPLREANHRRVVPRHIVRQASDRPSALTQTHAKLRLFAGDHARVETAGFLERADSKEGDTAAAFRIAGGNIPFHVAQAIVDRSLWKPLTKPSRDGRQACVADECLARDR